MTEQVWVAIDQGFESNVVLVCATEDGLLRQIRDYIGRDQYEEFAASLQGDEATAVTFDDDARDVLRVWSGEVDPDGAEGGYFIGQDWLVRQVEVGA